GPYLSFHCHAEGLFRLRLSLRNQSAGQLTIAEGAIRFIGAISKAFSDERYAMQARVALQLRPWRSHQCCARQRRLEHGDNTHRELNIARRHVVKRAVGLEVAEADADPRRDVFQVFDLFGQNGFQFTTREHGCRAPKILPVWKGGMSTWRDTVRLRQSERFAHRLGIAGVPAAGNVAAGDD
ncbi:MAG: hypothetical protein AAFR33_15880, partial [Pseudomonadota bacterium]